MVDGFESGGGGGIQRLTIVDQVADALRSRILSGDLPEGVQLRQENLAAELGVSRIPIREAFRRLEAEGLVTIAPHRGAIVSVLSIDEIAELFDLRAIIEPDLIARACPALTPEALLKSEEILLRYAVAFKQRDVVAWGTLNTAFHLSLYQPAKRQRSLAIAQTLLDQTDRYTRMQLLLTSGQSRAADEHAALLEACRSRDADRAANLLTQHVRSAGESLLKFLRDRRKGNSNSVLQSTGTASSG
jgi:DNA-binding GntR family transcriptional regulator